MQKTKPLQWQLQSSIVENETRLYAISSNGEWDGDETGHEWIVGFTIIFLTTGEPPYGLYFDDGKGNGKHISSAAIRLRNQLDSILRGF